MNGLRLRLPATSANLGPGFDAVGLALSLWLEIEAETGDAFEIEASGRDSALVGSLERNLMVDTYRAVAPQGPPLRLRVANGIPLGMGCGSSAAALVAGVMLANHFGVLGWTEAEVLDEACRREGHPDNVAACLKGGFTVSSMSDGRVTAASFGETLDWRLLLVLPRASLATEKARSLLPNFYSRAHVVQNIQATALLVAAFAAGDQSLLRAGTEDQVHQPYRREECPLLRPLLKLRGKEGIGSVSLSGAGPSVLVILEADADGREVTRLIAEVAGDSVSEIVETRVAGGASSHKSNVTKVL